MSKYRGLADHLAGRTGAEWRTNFDELSELLGGALPKTARSGVAWWANDPQKAQAKAWLDHGWQVRDVDPKTGSVIFMKADAPKPKKAAAAKASPKAAAKPKRAPKKAAPPATVETSDVVAHAPVAPVAPAAPAPQAAPDAEPAFLDRLPGGNKTAVMGGLAAAVLGVGALIARAFLRNK